jgi:hypothetical protein
MLISCCECVYITLQIVDQSLQPSIFLAKTVQMMFLRYVYPAHLLIMLHAQPLAS